MRILITSDTYFPMINGVVTSINNLYRELRKQGHDVKILTLSNSCHEKVEGDVYYLKSTGIGVYPDARIKYPFHNKLISEIIEWKPDIIHSQTEFSMMLKSKYISKKLNIPHVHTYHTMYEDYIGYILDGKLINKSRAAKITKFILNSVDSVIAPTEKVKKVLQSYGVKKPIYIVPTGIDLNRFKKELYFKEKQEIMTKLNITNGDRVIAYVGRIAEEKNISEVINLFQDVVKIVKNAKLLIVGGGPYLKNLKEQVKNEKLENSIIFTGMIKPEEVYKYYKLAEIFVTASTSETQGLTYLEALSSGCSVICRYDPCIDGIIEHGKNGFTYKEDWQFAYYINKVLQNDYLSNTMRKEAVLKAKQHSTNVFGDRILDVYDNLLKGEENSIALNKVTN